jgi:hypothetical protein
MLVGKDHIIMLKNISELSKREIYIAPGIVSIVLSVPKLYE